MNHKNLIIKNKLINHIITDGKKKTSEKILLKSFKKLQKYSNKDIKNIIQLSIINFTPLFKIHQSANKKQKKRNRRLREIPTFIVQSKIRTSLAIKLILQFNEKKSISFYKALSQKFLLNATSKKGISQTQIELQNKVLQNKKFFMFYRWT